MFISILTKVQKGPISDLKDGNLLLKKSTFDG